MTEDELLKQFGVTPDGNALDDIRAILQDETAREHKSQGDGDTEVMKLCCVQLFSAACLDDILRIWAAKSASFDASVSIDVQLLCGPGLSETKAFLSSDDRPEATAALSRILECESAGDFAGFSPSEWLGYYKQYYADTPEN